jgi:hypothetical protein
MTARTATAASIFVAPHQPTVRHRQGGTRYIIELLRRGEDDLPMGQVADLDWGLLYAPVPIASILARGYWQELAEPLAAADVLAKVRPA